MLGAIRKHTTGIVVKIFLGVLILSFAVWGIGDMVRSLSNGSRMAATVGGVEITPEQLGGDFRREMNRLRRTLGNSFSSDQARTLGIGNAVLGGLINSTLLGLAANDLGIAISDNLVGNEIRKNRAFKGIIGKFDRAKYQQLIRNEGFSERGFEQRTRKDLATAMLTESLGSGLITPPGYVDILYKYRNEKRVADVMRLADKMMTGIGEPDQAALDKYHREHAARFTSPEYRSLSVISLLVSDMVKEISVSEEQIKEAYDQRADEFVKPERRHLQQILVAREEDAKLIEKELAKGRDFKKVAMEMAGMDKASIDLGTVSRDEILPELVSGAFSTAEGKVSDPIKSPLGWHIIMVAGVEAEGLKTLDQVRETLKAEIAREKAVDGLYSLSNKLEDILGGGATLEEAASKLNAKLIKIAAIDRKGLDKDGKKVPDLPAGDFIKIAFETSEGMESPLSEAGKEGYFIVRVDGVTPPALRPLASVRDKVVAAWKEDQQAKAAEKEAEAIIKELRNGKDFSSVASQKGVKITTTKPFTREGKTVAGDLPVSLVNALFKAKLGDFATARGKGAALIARLKEIQVADPAADKDGYTKFAEQINNSFRNDILFQLLAALRQRYPVKVNTQVVDQLY